MLRQNDPVSHHVDISFWEYVEKMDDGRMRCKFCGHLFAKGTSISRIKLHLAGVTGRGVKICGQVPQDVQDAALAAIDGPPEKKLKTVAGSSNKEVTNAISASAQQQNNEMMMAQQRGDLSLEDWMASIPVEDMELLERGRFHERPSFNQADEHRGDPSQPTHDQLCSPSVNNDATMNVAQNVVGVRTEPVVQVLEQSNAELDNLSVDAGRKQVGVQGMEQRREEERICLRLDMENTSEGFTHHVDGNVSPCSLTVDVNDNRREDTQIKDLVHHLAGEPWDQISTVLMEEVDVESNTGRFGQPGARASSSGVLNYNTSETRGDPLSCAISASAQEHNNKVIHVEMAQEPFFTEEIACDLFGGGIELVHYAPETRPITEHASLETELPWGRSSPEELPHDACETIPRTELVPLLERGSSHERPSINQVDKPRGDSSQPADLLCLGHARYDEQLCSPAENNDAIMNDVQNMDRMRKEPVEKEEDMENNSGRSVQSGAGARSSEGLKHNPSETRGAPLPTGSTKLVGRAFEENRNVIWSWLMDDEILTISIYGMGGAGKTTMLKHIYNELLRIADISHRVYWVTVSRDFSIHTLQKKIAKRINLSISNEEEELHIAAELSLELEKKQKWILILDDLWNSFELHKVGIPVSLKGCKLIITTRSEAVCRQMHSRNNVRVNPLSDKEAWTLFTEILGRGTQLSPEVEQIAKSITRECDGLPLGIKTIAGTMKGVDDIHEWSDALEGLRQSRVMQDKVEEEVFQILRFSYTHLNDIALQQCFLYCALFPEDFMIPRENLIDYLIDGGVVKGQKSREAEINKGHTMLNRLENVCLLERLHGGDFVKMHDLIRDMAIQILEENSQAIVKAGAQLKELPDTEEWTEKLTTVSLMHNQIEEICSSHSPSFQNLSTLLLCNNYRLRFIAGSFFEQLHVLKVLDLSETAIECLPESVSDLVGLTSLLLKDCLRLSRVPSLKKLRALKRLDLSHTPLKKIPHGMKCLSNLRYLRMNRCGEKKFPGGILPKLSHLQVLILEERVLGYGRMGKEITVEGKEVGCLRKLESLECYFEDHSNYVEYLKSWDETQSLRKYKIVVGQFREDKFWEGDPGSKMVAWGNWNINRDGDFQIIFSNEFQALKCIDARSLGDVLPLKYATELEVIRISSCNSMESLVSSSWFCSAPPPSPSYNGIFSGLKKFYCCGCKSMKKLFPLVLLPNLVNLEEITVMECEKIEQIISGTRSDEEGVMGEESSTNTGFNLPKLRHLELRGLPELKSICSAKRICESLEVIKVSDCKSMESLVPSSWFCSAYNGGTRSDEEGVMGEESSTNTRFNLPKLRHLELRGLPELKSICSAKLICESLEVIQVSDCKSMESLVPSSWFSSAALPSPCYNGMFASLKGLYCCGCKSMKNLFPLVLLPNLVNLEEIIVEDCEKMEEIICGTRSDEEGVMGEESSANTGFNLPNLRKLKLWGLPELKSICSAKLICDSLEVIQVRDCKSMESLVPSSWSCSATLPSPSYNGMFASLKEFYCCGCKSMKNLFPLFLLPNLVNLEEIIVEDCEKMEEIICGTRSDEERVMGEESSANTGFNLLNLRKLKLWGLPELKSICSAKLICDSLEVIQASDCKSMESLVPSSWFCSATLPSPSYNGGTRSDEEGVMGEESSTNTRFNLPKLRCLELSGLPELRSICCAKLICKSLEFICITKCEKLKRLGICLPLLENGQPSPPPSLKVIMVYSEEWWESVVEWEHPKAKDVLRPFVRFLNEPLWEMVMENKRSN